VDILSPELPLFRLHDEQGVPLLERAEVVVAEFLFQLQTGLGQETVEMLAADDADEAALLDAFQQLAGLIDLEHQAGLLRPVRKHVGSNETAILPVAHLHASGGREGGVSHQPQEHVEHQRPAGVQVARDVAQGGQALLIVEEVVEGPRKKGGGEGAALLPYMGRCRRRLSCSRISLRIGRGVKRSERYPIRNLSLTQRPVCI